MSEIREFKNMIREAMLGEEPFAPDPGRAALENAVRSYEDRMSMMRKVTWLLMVPFGAAVFGTGIWLLSQTDAETTTREWMIYGLMALFGYMIVGFGKLWFLLMQNHFSLMREVKAAQIQIQELSTKRAG